jgi:hypothetical protein
MQKYKLFVDTKSNTQHVPVTCRAKQILSTEDPFSQAQSRVHIFLFGPVSAPIVFDSVSMPTLCPSRLYRSFLYRYSNLFPCSYTSTSLSLIWVGGNMFIVAGHYLYRNGVLHIGLELFPFSFASSFCDSFFIFLFTFPSLLTSPLHHPQLSSSALVFVCLSPLCQTL